MERVNALLLKYEIYSLIYKKQDLSQEGISKTVSLLYSSYFRHGHYHNLNNTSTLYIWFTLYITCILIVFIK